MKLKKIFYIIILLFGICSISLGLAACNDSTTPSTDTEKPNPDDDKKPDDDKNPDDDKKPDDDEKPDNNNTLADVVFEDASFVYDGKPHGLEVKNLPAGATAKYENNNKVDAGTYNVNAIVTLGDQKVYKRAKLTITKASSVLTVEDNQIAYIYGEYKLPSYELDNDVQEVDFIVKQNGVQVDKTALDLPGEYQIEMFALASLNYKASNHVTVNFTVRMSQFEVSYKDQDFVCDGNAKSIELTGNLPEGYTVSYSNNTGTDAGTYYAVAQIKNAAGETVEEHYATMTIDNPDNAEFEAYLDDFFVEYLEGDQLSVNIFCEHPEDFGLGRYDAVWYTYDNTESDSTDVDPIATFENYLQELHQYENQKLSQRQLVAYEQIEDFLTSQKNSYSIDNLDYMKNHYIDQFGGYVADFGTYMEAYTFREEADVQDVINFTLSTATAFPSYLLYLEDKTKAGYPLSDYTLMEMENYLNEIIETMAGDGKYYLEDVINAKIEALTFLDATAKTNYQQQFSAALNNEFETAVKTLYDGLKKFHGKLAVEDEGYWTKYEKGKDVYLLELNDLLGIDDFDVEKYIQEVEQMFNYAAYQNSVAISNLVKKHNVATFDDIDQLIARNLIFDGTPDEMMGYLKEFAKSIVPTLDYTPTITIKEMDMASAKVSNAVAYYMKSALDNDKSEVITLNPVKLGDKNDVLGTLAHEGYPGHLYAFSYLKQTNLHNISKIMTCTAHGEGWATYVELQLYQYAMKNSTNEEFIDVMKYLYANALSGFLLETRLDVGIHYEGWGVDEVAKVLTDHGYADQNDMVAAKKSAKDIINLLIETPASYASYGYGKLVFYTLHEEAKEILGGYFDEVEFNEMLLSKGWTTLGTLQKTYEEYMAKQMHRYGIELN